MTVSRGLKVVEKTRLVREHYGGRLGTGQVIDSDPDNDPIPVHRVALLKLSALDSRVAAFQAGR